MPPLTDPGLVRARLETDRPWAAFALADLEPPYSAHATWFVPPDSPHAIGLLYRAFGTPIVLLAGSSGEWASLLHEMDAALGGGRDVYAVVKPDALPVITSHYLVNEQRPMVRMVLDQAGARPPVSGAVSRLGPLDLGSIQALYADEPPAFFLTSMLHDGVYYGIREHEDLIAVAGTHVVARDVSVAALGNIYTRADRRGRGLATATTNAVASGLVRLGISTIVLNVREDNQPAVRVYERLGFKRYL